MSSQSHHPSCLTGMMHTRLQQLTLRHWDQWGLEIPVLIEIRSPADLHHWLITATPAQTTALLTGFARLAPTDDLALGVLAWLLTGVLTIAGIKEPDHDRFVGRVETTLRTIPWENVDHIPTYVLTRLTDTGSPAAAGGGAEQPHTPPWTSTPLWDQATLF